MPVKGYSAPIWMTFRQALELSAHVRKGERGSTVVYASKITRTGTDAETSRAAEGDAGNRFPNALSANLAAFRQGLSETGYVDGQNITIEYRWAQGHYVRLPGLAAELVARKIDVMVTYGASAIAAAKRATATIPIVFFGATVDEYKPLARKGDDRLRRDVATRVGFGVRRLSTPTAAARFNR